MSSAAEDKAGADAVAPTEVNERGYGATNVLDERNRGRDVYLEMTYSLES